MTSDLLHQLNQEFFIEIERRYCLMVSIWRFLFYTAWKLTMNNDMYPSQPFPGNRLVGWCLESGFVIMVVNLY